MKSTEDSWPAVQTYEAPFNLDFLAFLFNPKFWKSLGQFCLCWIVCWVVTYLLFRLYSYVQWGHPNPNSDAKCQGVTELYCLAWATFLSPVEALMMFLGSRSGDQ